MNRFLVLESCFSDAAVAQLDRVLGYEPRGRGFDSCQPHHLMQSLMIYFMGLFAFWRDFLRHAFQTLSKGNYVAL
jgi:hypothetical protein